MYGVIKQLVDDKKLNVDSTTVVNIADQLLEIEQKIALSSDSSKADVEALKAAIEKQLQTELGTKASTDEIDSLKIQLATVLQESSDQVKATAVAQEQEVKKALEELNQLQYSCRIVPSKIDSMAVGDTLYYYYRCLSPRRQIIGWQDPWMNDKYADYNFNYLSSLALYGFNFNSQGSLVSSRDLKRFEDSGIIPKAHEFGCNVSMTVYNRKPTIISAFLQNNSAQSRLISTLQELANKHELDGINLYFDGLNPRYSNQFTSFVKLLSSSFRTDTSSFQLTVTLPAIKHQQDRTAASAYNFLQLEPYVDYYIILTDRLIQLNNGEPGPPSPLFKSKNAAGGSVESTITYYSNGKIPISKLVVTFSYLGIDWKVDALPWKPSYNISGKYLAYNKIQTNYASLIGTSPTVIEGFDKVKMAAYINVLEDNQNNQIWFENENSLFQKYNWILESGLGGVAIRGLGADVGYEGLWQTLGGTMIQIDTVVTDKKYTKDTTVQESKLVVFWEDSQWAAENYLRFQQKDSLIDCDYYDYRSELDSIENRWALQQHYAFDSENEEDNFLENKGQCLCLLARWELYAKVLLVGWIATLLITIILFGVVEWLDRYNLQAAKARLIIRIARIVCFILFGIFLIFWIYFAPYIESIGAESNATRPEVLLIPIVLGILIGYVLNRLINKNKLVPKNLP